MLFKKQRAGGKVWKLPEYLDSDFKKDWWKAGQERMTHGWKCTESIQTEVIATGMETCFKGFNVVEHRQIDELCSRIIRNWHEEVPKTNNTSQ